MPIISPQEARDHVRGSAADDAQLALYARAAERAAMQFLNRQVYATQQELDDAQAQAALTASEIGAAYDAAVEAANAMDDLEARAAALRVARLDYDRAHYAMLEVERGMVVVDDVKVGMLLILGHLFRNREATVSDQTKLMEMGAYSFLWPYRVGLGV